MKMGIKGFVALLAVVLASGAWAAPEQVAVVQARENLLAAFQAQVDEATRALSSGGLEGQRLALQLRKRGVGYSHLQQYDLAVADFTRAIELDGFNPQFYQDRAISYLRQRDFARASTDLDMVLGLDRDNFGGLREKGRVAFYQGDFDRAAQYFLQASRVVDRDGQIYAALWVNLAAQRAGKPATLRVEASGGNARVRWPVPVADLYAGTLEPERVLEMADSSNPQTFLSLQCEAQFYLGQYYLMKGRKDDARASFQAAVDTGKTDYMEYDWSVRELELLK